MERLDVRQVRLCLNFAVKAVRHSKFKSWFLQTEDSKIGGRAQYAGTISRLNKLGKSPIPYLTRLLNTHNSK